VEPRVTRAGDRLELSGAFQMASAANVWRTLHALIAGEVDVPRLDIDVSRVTAIDGAVVGLLVELRAELASRGVVSEIVGASDLVRPLVHVYEGDRPPRPEVRPPDEPWVERIGDTIAEYASVLRDYALFVGDVALAVGRILRQPSSLNWRAMPQLLERTGIDGVIVVMLLNFLVGLVMAFQSSHQLKVYGANIFVADVVGISMTRELAPLMTAIIMSGRSGAAFAAELGTMKVTEEIDALRTLGFTPTLFLVVPRIIALAIVAPVLTLLGDVVGVAGGAFVGVANLDVSSRGYLAELRSAVGGWDIGSGLIKSVAFAVAIAFIGCQRGSSAPGDAAGVGRSTTATVVSSLFAIVLLDTGFTVLFRAYGV
jgi:phospholipid/cholesterol/gamma-HCH transport system permease protein